MQFTKGGTIHYKAKLTHKKKTEKKNLIRTYKPNYDYHHVSQALLHLRTKGLQNKR